MSLNDEKKNLNSKLLDIENVTIYQLKKLAEAKLLAEAYK